MSKCKNAIFLNIFTELQNFFIFSINNDICGAKLYAKFQDTSPYKITRYCGLYFLKLHFLMTSAIRTPALISPVFTCEMTSAPRRTCNIRCFTQLFVVNMIAKPIWAKDVKFGVRCFCLVYL